MYNPALPNHYRDVAFTAFVRRRQREEAEAEERSAQPNALAAALSSVSSSALLDASPPTTLNQSAEELHQKRIKESAALGIASAVAMEKAALEEEHQQRRRDGADARSRISDRLERLRALSMKAKGLTSESPVSAAAAAAASSVPAVEAQGGSPSPYSAPSTAPLVFQRSSLAAGGYVMTAAPAAPTSPPSSSSSSSLLPPGSAVSSSGATPLSTLAAFAAGSSSPPSPPSVRGKPSSTLLLRYSRNSPVQLWPEAALARAAESHRVVTAATLGEGKDDGEEEEGDVCRTVLDQVAQLCKRFGVVRAVKARVFSGDAVLAVFPQLRGMAEEVKGEQLRLWVRYESATEAFKAAEGLAKESVRTALGEAVLSVVFFPTSLFDADKLDLRSEDELASA